MLQDARDKYPLFRLHCMDLLVLQEIEYAGIKFDTEAAREHAAQIQTSLDSLTDELATIIGDVPFNFNSGDNVSALLYGGIIPVDDKIPTGVFKTGEKAGQVKYKKIIKEYSLPRLIEPLPDTELKKGPDCPYKYWKSNDDILRTVKLSKEAKKVVDLIKKYTKLDKLRGTYLLGWSNLIDKMNWKKDMIHGNLNQCAVVTGRLASSKPNLQNADPTTKIYCVSRY